MQSERTTKAPFLGAENWRQTIAIVVSILIVLLPSLGILVSDHYQIQRNTTDIVVEQTNRHEDERRDEAWKSDTEKRMDHVEDKADSTFSIVTTLSNKLDILSEAMTQLTLAVQKATLLSGDRKSH